MRSICPVESDHPLVFERRPGEPAFYCVNEERPPRDQLSAKFKMWCLDHCRKENTRNYFCSTLFGRDLCSPASNIGSYGTKCSYPCEREVSAFAVADDYFFCYTSKDNNSWEYCGQWNVPEEKKSIVEFTRYCDKYVFRISNTLSVLCMFSDMVMYVLTIAKKLMINPMSGAGMFIGITITLPM